MGYKIFISYKYHDDSVYPIKNFSSLLSVFNRSTVRDYVDRLESYFDHTNLQIFQKKIRGTKYDTLGVVKCIYVFLFFSKTSGGAK